MGHRDLHDWSISTDPKTIDGQIEYGATGYGGSVFPYFAIQQYEKQAFVVVKQKHSPNLA